MEKTIEYHKLLPGAFEKPESAVWENDEFIVGNRWSFSDLNSYIREEEPWFHIESHSALGGCCDRHPAETPIFPEEFSRAKLDRLKARFNSYFFSCQYLNNPIPDGGDFKEEWLNYYTIQEPCEANRWCHTIEHEVTEGVVRKNIDIFKNLSIAMAVDPNHSGNSGLGRCRHAIVVAGQSVSGDVYLLDYFAEASGYDKFYAEIYRLADKWHLTKFGLETIGAQSYIGDHIRKMNRLEGRSLRILELRAEVEGIDGELTRKKEFRIRESLAPIAERCQMWVQRRFQKFQEEYTTFPKGKFVDILDAFAYIPQLIKAPMKYEQQQRMLSANQQGASRVNQPYGVQVN
jgi:hypothetical protein